MPVIHKEAESEQRMAVWRLVLIGHSGAGKTMCLDRLGINRQGADMDAALTLQLSQSDYEAARASDTALKWLASRDTPRVVTLRNDEKMLYAMKNAKVTRRRSFRRFALVYLHYPEQELEQHLQARTDKEAVKYTLATYDRFHRELFSKLADRTIECSGKTIEAVVGEISEMASHLNGENV